MMISIKRNSLLKAYKNSLNSTSDDAVKKYEDSYALYLESIDKYIMDSLYKKVRNNTATSFEKEAVSKYYFIVSLKAKNYIEYKYKKQEYLLRIDYETVSNLRNEKTITNYKEFYLDKVTALYKGLLKNYSIEIADNVHNDKEDVYKKIFTTLETYIMEILPIKIEQGDNTAKEEYEQYLHTTVGKLDERDKLMQKVVLLSVSRKMFIHSLPLVATEKCYLKLIEEARTIVANSKNENKRKKAYETLCDIIEDYYTKILATKVYWDNLSEREQFKKFWEKFKNISENKEKRQILLLKQDIKTLNIDRKRNSQIIEMHKKRLLEMKAIKSLSCHIKTYNKLIYNKRPA